MFSFFAVSCDKNEEIQEVIVPQDRYYVKYEMSMNTKYPNATMKFLYELVDDKNNIITGNYSKAGHLELTYGPVSKGFEARINAYYEITYSGSRTGQPCQISVSINEEPFTLKASGIGAISYKIE